MITFQEVGRLLEEYMHTGQIPKVEGLSEEHNVAFNHIVQAIPHGVYSELDFTISFFLQEEHRLKEVTSGEEYATQLRQRVGLRELLAKREDLGQLSEFRSQMSNNALAAMLVEDFIVLARKSE